MKSEAISENPADRRESEGLFSGYLIIIPWLIAAVISDFVFYQNGLMISDYLLNIKNLRNFLIIDDIRIFYVFLFPVVTGVILSYSGKPGNKVAGLLSIAPAIIRIMILYSISVAGTAPEKILPIRPDEIVYVAGRTITVLALMFLLGAYICNVCRKYRLKRHRLVTIFLFIALFTVYPVYGSECKKLTTGKSGKISLKKLCPEFESFTILNFKNNVILFTANTKNITKTCRMADLNDWRNLYLCRFDTVTGKLVKRKFPEIDLMRKFDVVCGESIYIAGRKNIAVFNSKDLTFKGMFPVNNLFRLIAVKNQSSHRDIACLVTQEGGYGNKDSIIRVLNPDSLKTICKFENAEDPLVTGKFLIFTEIANTKKECYFAEFNSDLAVFSKPAKIIMPFKSSDSLRFFSYSNSLIIAGESRIVLSDPHSGKNEVIYEQEAGQQVFYAEKLFGDLLILSGKKVITVLNIKSRDIVLRENKELLVYCSGYSSENKTVVIPIYEKKGEIRFIIIDENGKIQSDFIIDDIKYCFVSDGFLISLSGSDLVLGIRKF
ncbi:MAG: hypothetical protein LWY06_00390 [Firmicutes bacterium]|nr:hypothetical protein [Bacillota bacterium]